MSVPDVAVTGALLAIARSAIRWAVVVAADEFFALHDALPILVAVTVAVLAIGPVAAGLMCTTIVKGWVASGASVPKLQVTVPAVVVQIGRASCRKECGGRRSVSVPQKKVECALLLTVMEWAMSVS